MATWLRNVDQFRRFDVADRNQNVFNARFNHGIGAALDASVGLQVRDVEYPASEYGRNDHQQTDVPVGGAQLAAVSDHERLRVLLVSSRAGNIRPASSRMPA